MGRFCRECKSKTSSFWHAKTSFVYISTSKGRIARLESEPSRSDINKLLSFTDTPRKYATGSARAKEKVEYLESIKHKLSEGQLAAYISARAEYDAEMALKKQPAIQKENNVAILTEAFNNHRSVRIQYKGAWRTIDPYSLNNMYVVAYCHMACDIRTFRVDRIQEIELLGEFSFDESLQEKAHPRLTEAPTYRGYRRRY